MIVALTGHRKLGSYQIPNPTFTYVREQLRQLLTELKPTSLLSGMALGFDTLGAQVALELGIPFEAVIPYEGQEKRWYPKDQAIYQELLTKAANRVTVSSGGFDYWKMHARNQHLVDHCDLLISCWDGRKEGGTYHCLKYAQKIKRPTTNIDPTQVSP